MSTSRQIIYSSRESAYLSLLVSKIETGHLYLKRYTNQEGKLDILMAYGVRDCTTGYPDSIDSVKIISGDSPFPVYNVVYYNPDVSELARGQVFLWVDMRDDSKMDCDVWLVTIEKNEEDVYEKNIVEFGDITRKVYSLTQGEFYFVSSHSFRAEENFYTREEIQGTIVKAINEDIMPSLVELQRTVFPINVSFTLGTQIAEIGTTVDIPITYAVTRKDLDVKDDCTITVLDQDGNNISIYGDLIRGVSKDTTYTLNAEYELGYSGSKSQKISFVHKSYWGVASNTETITPNLVSSLRNSALRQKGTLSYTNISLDLEKTVIYAYPKSYGSLKSIKDANGFEYLYDYNKTQLTINGVDYFVYSKITPTIINNFIQTFSF